MCCDQIETSDKAKNIVHEQRQNRHKKKKEDTEKSRLLRTHKRQTFISFLQQNTNSKYKEHQFKISLFHCWYVLFTG